MASSTSPKKSAPAFPLELDPRQREAFLNKVETQIAQYVKRQRGNCLAVIEKKPHLEDETHTPNLISKFPLVFGCFLLGKKYRGQEVESALVAPIVTIISEAYGQFVRSNAADLEGFLKGQLARNIARLSLQEIREHCAVQAARTTKVAGTILHGKGHLVSASVVKDLSLKPIIAHGIEMLIAKMIGETVIEKTIEAAGLKKFAALANELIAQALIFYILYKALKFPKRLGKTLGAEVRSMLDGNMTKLNATFLKAMREELLKLTVMDVLSDYATSTISDVVNGDRADVCKKLIEKFHFEAHPLDTLFKDLLGRLNCSKGLDKGFVMDLIKKKEKSLQGPAAEKVSKRLRKLLSKAATMSVTEIIASLISIRLCTGHNVK